jgi:hypothetical protein
MDPYLEHPGLWPDVHHELISEVRAALSFQLRPKYFVRVEERVYVTDDLDPARLVLIPDVRVTLAPRPKALEPSYSASAVGIVEPIEVIDPSLEIHEARLEIIDRGDRQVVTVIEILSPSNKVLNSRGRDSYLQERQEVLESPSHFVEIDLLRQGSTVRFGRTWPDCPYAVQVSRAERRPIWSVWPIRIRDRLPPVKIPLRSDDPDAPLDLQQVLDTAYERAAYDADIDYSQPPVPPLDEEDAAWAGEIVKRTKG